MATKPTNYIKCIKHQCCSLNCVIRYTLPGTSLLSTICYHLAATHGEVMLCFCFGSKDCCKMISALSSTLHMWTHLIQRYDSQCKQQLTELKNQSGQQSCIPKAYALAVHVAKHHSQYYAVAYFIKIPPLAKPHMHQGLCTLVLSLYE